MAKKFIIRNVFEDQINYGKGFYTNLYNIPVKKEESKEEVTTKDESVVNTPVEENINKEPVSPKLTEEQTEPVNESQVTDHENGENINPDSSSESNDQVIS